MIMPVPERGLWLAGLFYLKRWPVARSLFSGIPDHFTPIGS
jgi:hypothetical protein